MPKYFRDPECLSVYYDQHLRSFNDVDVVVLDRADWARLVELIVGCGGDGPAIRQIHDIIAKVKEANDG